MKNLTNVDITYFVHKECAPSWTLEREIFPIYGLVIVLEGSAHYIINGEDYNVGAGDLVLFRPGCTRSATTGGMVCAALDFTLSGGGSLDLPVVSRYERTSELDNLIREFQYEWLQKGEGYRLKCGALFLLLLHALRYGAPVTQSNLHVEKMKRYIVDHFTEQINVRSLAKVVGLNTVYCGALFRKTQGLTVAEYTNRIRVRKAAALLEESGGDITSVAYLCGFNDVYYFSNIFKRYMGVSPSAYKARPARAARSKPLEQLRLLQD